MSTSQGRYRVNATGRWTGKVKDELDAQVPLANIQSATVTLIDEMTGSAVNSRSAQDIIGGVGGSGVNNFDFADTGSDTNVGWDIQTDDVALADGEADRGEHLAQMLFTYTQSGETKISRHDFRLRILDAPGICTWDDVAQQVQGITEATWRIMVEDAIEGLGDQFEHIAQRKLRKVSSDVTRVFSIRPGQRRIYLPHYPIESITSIKEAYDGQFGSVTALDSTDYFFETHKDSKGAVTLYHRNFIHGAGTVQVVYKGGLARATGAVPPRLRFAAARQVAYWWQRRDELGLSAVSIPGQSVSFFAGDELMPAVEKVFKSFRRRRT